MPIPAIPKPLKIYKLNKINGLETVPVFTTINGTKNIPSIRTVLIIMLLSPYLLRLLVLKYLLTLRFKIFEKPGSPGLENFGVLILGYVLRIITLLNLKKTTSEL
jgi:hypothetical protein